jgi:hypothetical protein
VLDQELDEDGLDAEGCVVVAFTVYVNFGLKLEFVMGLSSIRMGGGVGGLGSTGVRVGGSEGTLSTPSLGTLLPFIGGKS